MEEPRQRAPSVERLLTVYVAVSADRRVSHDDIGFVGPVAFFYRTVLPRNTGV